MNGHWIFVMIFGQIDKENKGRSTLVLLSLSSSTLHCLLTLWYGYKIAFPQALWLEIVWW